MASASISPEKNSNYLTPLINQLSIQDNLSNCSASPSAAMQKKWHQYKNGKYQSTKPSLHSRRQFNLKLTAVPLTEINYSALQFQEYFKIPSLSFEKHFNILGKIGEGAHCVVYKVQEVISDKIYAAKILRTDDIEKAQSLKTEYDILNSLENEHIPQVYKIFIDDQHCMQVIMIFDFVNGSTLQSLLLKQPFNQTLIFQIFKQLLTTLDYLHKNDVFHRDITLSNIILNEGQIKLLDFGVSKSTSEENSAVHSPLLQLQFQELSMNSTLKFQDFFQAGLVILQLLVGNAITANCDISTIFQQIHFDDSTMWKVLSQILLEKSFEFSEKLFEDSQILSERNFNCNSDYSNQILKSKQKNILKGSENYQQTD